MFELITKKNSAMQIGYNSYNILKDYILLQSTMPQEETSLINDNFSPTYTPKEMLDLLYNSNEYRNFVIDSLVLKKICKKIFSLQLSVFLTLLFALFATLAFIKLTALKIIFSIILIFIGFIFFFSFKTGKSYQQYYNETMVQILNMAVNEYTITSKEKNTLFDKNFINNHLNIHYDKYSMNYNCKFESQYEVGDEFELTLTDIVETKDKDGNTTKKEETVFDGFSIVSRNKQPHSVLNGSIIKIRDDHNIASALLEDTVNSIIQSKKDFSFNSEKLNKHLDCRLSRTGLTSDVDQKMFEVTKIITPAFEEKLLFLDERYNAFNMNLSDNEFSFTVNMKKDTFQKLQNGELFKLHSTYKEKNHNTNIFSDVNFEYDRLYPILERLFLRKYFRIIYNYQMDSNRFDNYEFEKTSQYETEIKEIMNMPYKEFSQINADYVKDLKEDINFRYNELSSKEKI